MMIPRACVPTFLVKKKGATVCHRFLGNKSQETSSLMKLPQFWISKVKKKERKKLKQKKKEKIQPVGHCKFSRLILGEGNSNFNVRKYN